MENLSTEVSLEAHSEMVLKKERTTYQWFCSQKIIWMNINLLQC